MWITRAVATVGASVVLTGPATAAVAAPALDVVPALTSTPFATRPGQSVTHTVALSSTGAGALTSVRVTFTTTVALDNVTASAAPGTCPVVTALTVVCELGDVTFPDPGGAAPKVTIAGIVHPGTTAGTLIQNLVNVTAATPDADAANNVASNAYLVPAASAAPARTQTRGPGLSPSPSGGAARRLSTSAPAVALLALGALATATLVVVWRRRRRRS
jgi:hypothetical protein